MDLRAARGDAGGVFPAGVPLHCEPVAGHALRAGRGLVLVDHRVCGGRAGADDSGAFRHHDALLPKAVRGYCRLPSGAQRAVSALLRAGPRAGLSVLQLRLYLEQGHRLSAIRADDRGICDHRGRQRHLRRARHDQPAALHAGFVPQRSGGDGAGAQVRHRANGRVRVRPFHQKPASGQPHPRKAHLAGAGQAGARPEPRPRLREAASGEQRNAHFAQRGVVSHGQKQVRDAGADDAGADSGDNAGAIQAQIPGRAAGMSVKRERDGAGRRQLPERGAV